MHAAEWSNAVDTWTREEGLACGRDHPVRAHQLMDTTLNWPELLKHPGRDHLVQVYRDPQFLAETVNHYIASGLAAGEAALVIARHTVRKRIAPSPAVVTQDADETHASFMVDGMPEWTAFHEACGGALSRLRGQYPAVRAYGEMVDILWQRGARPAAMRLEHFWNELGRELEFSLLCAYAVDPLDADSYGGALESICRCHTHLIPARDYSRFNQAVADAATSILDQPLAQMLLSLAANHRPHTEMPLGQAALIWLKQNMPRTADRVLEDVRLRLTS
jgi:hypothetical protein